MCCAIFCHAGHDLDAGSFGNQINTTCDCGAGILDKIPILNSKNPLNDCSNAHYIKSKCSLRDKGFTSYGQAIRKFIEMKYRIGLNLRNAMDFRESREDKLNAGAIVKGKVGQVIEEIDRQTQGIILSSKK